MCNNKISSTRNNISTLYNFHTNNGITFKLYYKKIQIYLFRIKIKNSLGIVNYYGLGRIVNALNARYFQYISYTLLMQSVSHILKSLYLKILLHISLM